MIPTFFYIIGLIFMLITHSSALGINWDTEDFDQQLVIAALKCLLWPVTLIMMILAALIANYRTIKAARRGGL